jgi:hypothetical protein
MAGGPGGAERPPENPFGFSAGTVKGVLPTKSKFFLKAGLQLESLWILSGWLPAVVEVRKNQTRPRC